MREIRIKIRDEEITDKMAISMVSQVIEMGRISGNGSDYCYVTGFDTGVGEVYVSYMERRKKTIIL